MISLAGLEQSFFYERILWGNCIKTYAPYPQNETAIFSTIPNWGKQWRS